MWTLCRSVAIAAVVGIGVAEAADVTPGFGASLRVGYGNPMGSVQGGAGADLGQFFGGQLPLQLDLGYRITPALSLAVYGAYALSSVGSSVECLSGGVSCSGSDVRIGLEVFWHLLPGQTMDPWAAIGFGYEWSKLGFEGPAGTLGEVTLKGLELLNLQAGADYPLTAGFGIGPFVQLTVAQYSTVVESSGGSSRSAELDSTRLHQWLQIGARGTFSL